MTVNCCSFGDWGGLPGGVIRPEGDESVPEDGALYDWRSFE